MKRLHHWHATNGYAGLNQLENQKPEAAESRGAVQTLRMENDAHVVGPDARIANGIGQFSSPRDSGVPENRFTRADLSGVISSKPVCGQLMDCRQTSRGVAGRGGSFNYWRHGLAGFVGAISCSPFLIFSPALRSPSTKCSTRSASHHLHSSSRQTTRKSGPILSSS